MKEGKLPIKILERPMVIGGDIILSVDGIDVDARNPIAIDDHLKSLKTGDEYTIRILRNGFKLDLKTTK